MRNKSDVLSAVLGAVVGLLLAVAMLRGISALYIICLIIQLIAFSNILYSFLQNKKFSPFFISLCLFSVIADFAVVKEYNIVNMQGLLLSVGAVALMLAVLMLLIFKKGVVSFKSFKPFELVEKSIIMIVACIMLSFLVISNANALLDFSKPQSYQASVMEKAVHQRIRGRGRVYYEYSLTLDFGGRKAKVFMDSDSGDSVEIGDSIEIELKSGALGFEYVVVKDDV